MSSQTNQTAGTAVRQQQAQTGTSERNADTTPNERRGGGLHPQTREAMAQAVKRAAAQSKRR